MDLKELLGEELYNQVSQKVGDNKIAIVSDGNWIPKDKFNSINDRKKELETQIKDLEKVSKEYEDLKPQLEAMKTASSENPLLKQQLEDLQKKLESSTTQLNDYQTKNTEWENKYKETQIDTAIKLGLVNAKVNPKYADLLSTKFDKSKFEFGEDGSIKGLDEQLQAVQESYKELFGEIIPPSGGTNPPGGGGNTPKDESKMTDAEWFAAHSK
ncbi:MAG: phage scaffolding protein [Bacillota bacterium]|nr:phage scaffolding protein [Bacillota bacterium]